MYDKKITALQTKYKELIAEREALKTEIVDKVNAAFIQAYPGNTFTVIQHMSGSNWNSFTNIDDFSSLTALEVEISAVNNCYWDRSSRKLIKLGLNYTGTNPELIDAPMELDSMQELAASLTEEYDINITV